MRIDSLILPAAPQANSRKHFGENGRADKALLPKEAVGWIGELIKGGKDIRSVNVCGPGDALAAPEALFPLLDLLREQYPTLGIKLTTNGLGAAGFAADLAAQGITRVDLQVDAVTAEMISKVYTWIRPGKKTVPLAQAAELLLSEQEKAVTALCKAGIQVNILTIIYPCINDRHIGALAEKMAALGASSMALIPFRPAPEEDGPPACDEAMLDAARTQAAVYFEKLPAYTEQYLTPPSGANFQDATALLPKPSKERPNVAVVSSNGMDIDLHLGQAGRVLIYGPRQDGLACLLESRETPEAGTGTSRWEALAKECLYDCFALLAANAGENPKTVLAEQGIKVLLTEDNIEGTVDVLYGGGKKKKCKK